MALYADLHNHTTFSDGELSPEDIVKEAREKGIRAVGITDHDTDAGLDRAVAAGEKYDVTVVPGVEISVAFSRAFFRGTLHLLCYFAPDMLSDRHFRKYLNNTLALGRGDALVRARVAAVNREFGPNGKAPLLSRDMTFEDIARYSRNATRRHFALALNQIFHMADRAEINRIIGNSSPAYLPSGVALQDVAPVMEKFPVTCSVAHPAAGSYPGEGHYKEVLPPVETVETIMPEFLEAGVKGIEVYYPGHADAHVDLLLSWARQYGLLVTGGSDCHDRKERPFGMAGISREDFEKFIEVLNRPST